MNLMDGEDSKSGVKNGAEGSVKMGHKHTILVERG